MGNPKPGKDNSKKLTRLLIALGVFVLVSSIILVTAIVKIVTGGSKEETTKYVISSSQSEMSEVGTLYDTGAFTGETFYSVPAVSDISLPEQNSEAEGVPSQQTLPPETQATQIAETSGSADTTSAQEWFDELNTMEKNGDNYLSDAPDNEFIALVNSKYNVPTEKLVAIYSIPDSGTNFVLQFREERDASGKIIKSPDTLEKVYNIGKDRSVKIATGKVTGNVGVGYAESLLCFGIVTESVMCQYPDYFTGVEDKRPNH